MMKRIVPFLLGFMVCSTLALADYSDGFITAGEYEYFVQLFNHDVLIVEGGGADIIEARDFSYVEVRYTSSPLGLDVGGVYDILLDGYSELLYLDGETEAITIYDYALATLKGGSINYIDSMQNTDTTHIDLYCQPGWSWLYDDEDFDGIDEIVGITGLWEADSDFNIGFINDYTFGYDPVWMNINIVEIPEPATLLLISFGVAFIRKR